MLENLFEPIGPLIVAVVIFIVGVVFGGFIFGEP